MERWRVILATAQVAAFGLWAGVVPLSAWWVVSRMDVFTDSVSEQVARGVLPVAEAQLANHENRLLLLEAARMGVCVEVLDEPSGP